MSFLYDPTGKRKYLTINERKVFLEAASTAPPEIHTFCATLAYTGARISEVLALTPNQIDYLDGLIIIECLKKRKPNVYRSVPAPRNLLELLNKTHNIRALQSDQNQVNRRIWSWCRTTAWKHVKSTMAVADLTGVNASPKALRHSFAVSALQKSVPLNIVRKWLGHSKLEITAIYADAVGDEEREIAGRLWGSFN